MVGEPTPPARRGRWRLAVAAVLLLVAGMAMETGRRHLAGDGTPTTITPTTVTARVDTVFVTVEAPPAPAPTPAPTPVRRTHTVTAGETLWGLALRYLGAGDAWSALVRADGTPVGDPRRLRIVTVLLIPTTNPQPSEEGS